MSGDAQKVLRKESQRCQDELWQYFLQYSKDSITDLEKVGVDIYYLPDSERAKWIEATRPVVEKFYSQIGPEDAKKIEDAAREANR